METRVGHEHDIIDMPLRLPPSNLAIHWKRGLSLCVTVTFVETLY
jgi:hypothetical protein